MSGAASLEEAQLELAELKRQLAAVQQKVSNPFPPLPSHSPSNTAHSYFNIDAGGLAVMVVTFFTAIVLALNVAGLFWFLDERGDSRAVIEDIRGQLKERRDGENAIRAYINTGILKPKTEPEKKP